MVDEPKDSYEHILKQPRRRELSVILLDGRGNWDDFARTAHKNLPVQRRDSPELDISLAMQEGGPDAVCRRVSDNLIAKALEQSMEQAMARTLQTFMPSYNPLQLTVVGAMAGTILGGMAAYALNLQKKAREK